MKLYEKDPSKLTSVDEAIPAVSTSSDLSDDEEEDSNLAEIKQEPMEVVPNMSLAPPPEAEHSTDSDTVSGDFLKAGVLLTRCIITGLFKARTPGPQSPRGQASGDARLP